MSANYYSEPNTRNLINSNEQWEIEREMALDNNANPSTPDLRIEYGERRSSVIESSLTQGVVVAEVVSENNLSLAEPDIDDDLYEALYLHFPCSICRDTLAKPCCLTTCHHSFCFACLQNQMLSGPPDAPVLCSECRAPFEKKDICFERQFSQLIESCMEEYLATKEEVGVTDERRLDGWFHRFGVYCEAQRLSNDEGRAVATANEEDKDDHFRPSHGGGWNIQALLMIGSIFLFFFLHRSKN